MISWIITCELGTDYYETIRICCDDPTTAINEVCVQLNCSYSDVVSVTRVVV